MRSPYIMNGVIKLFIFVRQLQGSSDLQDGKGWFTSGSNQIQILANRNKNSILEFSL